MHVIIRQLPRTPDIPPNKVKLELVVLDTGKVRTYLSLKIRLSRQGNNRGSVRIFSR